MHVIHGAGDYGQERRSSSFGGRLWNSQRRQSELESGPREAEGRKRHSTVKQIQRTLQSRRQLRAEQSRVVHPRAHTVKVWNSTKVLNLLGWQAAISHAI